MKNYFLVRDCDFCECITASKQEAKKRALQLRKEEKKKRGSSATLEGLQIRELTFNGKKYHTEDYFGEAFLLDKDGEPIDYTEREKLGIKEKALKKDFLYFNIK